MSSCIIDICSALHNIAFIQVYIKVRNTLTCVLSIVLEMNLCAPVVCSAEITRYVSRLGGQ